jgi:hypothetical protein
MKETLMNPTETVFLILNLCVQTPHTTPLNVTVLRSALGNPSMFCTRCIPSISLGSVSSTLPPSSEEFQQ